MDDAIQYKGHDIIVISDEMAQDPRGDDFSNLTKMICFHGKYDLGDNHDYSSDDYNGWSEMEDAIVKQEKPYVILPLYLYDHSGITISSSSFSCRWDSGQVGFILVNKEGVDTCMGWKRVTQERKEQLEKGMLAEIKTYDDYISGNVYGFVVEKDGEEKDRCCGFYGFDHEKSGLLELAKESINSFEV